MKKIILSAIAALSLSMNTAFAAGIPDHIGTDMSKIPVGTAQISSRVAQYNELFYDAGNQYGIDPNILAAVCMQESSGINYQYDSEGNELHAWGIMQIEDTNINNFAKFGEDRDGVKWTTEDRLDPSKAIPFAAYLLSESLYRYDGDYAKTIQAYNFGDTVFMRIYDAVGDNWLDERKNAVTYVEGWPYESYGDALYLEHVMQYYHNKIDYLGANVRMNGKLVKFNDQYPTIRDGFTLIPVRAIGENLGAKVSWDGEKQLVSIKSPSTELKLYINQTTAYINNIPYELEVPAQLINNRTMVPLRFIAEALGTDVNWDGKTRTVYITSAKS